MHFADDSEYSFEVAKFDFADVESVTVPQLKKIKEMEVLGAYSCAASFP